MIISEYYKPYHHIVIDNFLPTDIFKRINDDLYKIKCEIPRVDGEFERFSSSYPSCTPLTHGISEFEYIDWKLHDEYTVLVLNYINDIFDFSNPNKNYDNLEKIKTTLDGFYWSGYYEIGRDSFQPHTDNAWRNLIQDSYYAGIIKGVLYFGKEDIEYTNYGTILLNNSTRTFVKEVEFKPNRLILFDTRDDSLHATDYHSEMRSTETPIHINLLSNTTTQLEKKRFSFNIEYRAFDDLSLDAVRDMYNNIEYPNSRILERWMNSKDSL